MAASDVETQAIEFRLQIRDFVRESNAIEGIYRKPSKAEIEGTIEFLGLEAPEFRDVAILVDIYQPGALLRTSKGMNVRVGSYIAPPSGMNILHDLIAILRDLKTADPWDTHVRYERLHPFIDGNGRSGRALWAWQMVRRPEGLSLGFLHSWYYQTLSSDPVRRKY